MGLSVRHVSNNPYAGANWSTDTWAKANVHTHTTNSDGKMSPADVVNAYRDRGYKILSITDRIYVMYDGKVMAELVTKETNEDEIMFHAVGGKHATASAG